MKALFFLNFIESPLPIIISNDVDYSNGHGVSIVHMYISVNHPLSTLCSFLTPLTCSPWPASWTWWSVGGTGSGSGNSAQLQAAAPPAEPRDGALGQTDDTHLYLNATYGREQPKIFELFLYNCLLGGAVHVKLLN